MCTFGEWQQVELESQGKRVVLAVDFLLHDELGFECDVGNSLQVEIALSVVDNNVGIARCRGHICDNGGGGGGLMLVEGVETIDNAHAVCMIAQLLECFILIMVIFLKKI